ncbi:protein CHLOROPLAST IMPORT APPARATUS 2-like [Prosopis cineraria]|uniref:protein CHLOROPLAST IMPORT APPARATUS 2-like n=1 Tax=Prosopis cineraria TaxID=364024 RepID=UPI00240FA66B|nr:protein CHLOROPLAST IMPORT APPARATUS 2-like [Prosopis cineraria]
MSACLSGASGRTYGFDFDFVKSPSPPTRTSHSSSPSSTISESSDSPLAISTRKPRTPRKRPNQTYNEAAATLSKAYPNLFPSESLKKPGKFTKTTDNFADETSELLFPFQIFDTSSFLLQHQPIQQKPGNFPVEPKAVSLTEKACQSPGEISSRVSTQEFDDDCREDFDAESMLDEEIGEGIDSIMGSRAEHSLGASCHGEHVNPGTTDSTRFNFGGKFDFRLRALRGVDEGNYWRNIPAVVHMLEISPEIKKPAPAAPVSPEKKKKKTKKADKPTTIESWNPELPKESSIPKAKSNPSLLLKLNYNEVLNAWSDRSSPFTGESPACDVPGNDSAARLAQIDLLWDSGEGVIREASVMRYKEKRRTRLFSKKIRYQVRKVNADQRPRTQGRFARRPNGCSNAQSS